jgi:hypothetical protein
MTRTLLFHSSAVTDLSTLDVTLDQKHNAGNDRVLFNLVDFLILYPIRVN